MQPATPYQEQIVGYWGERTSNVDWCENNYEKSFYIAEFYNTLSSIPICLFSLIGLIYAIKYKYDGPIKVCFVLVIIIGLGSAAFHGTLLYFGQVMDELFMIYGVTAFVYAISDNYRTKKHLNLPNTFGCWIHNMLFLFTRIIPFFLITYSLGVLYVLKISIQIAKASDAPKGISNLIKASFAVYGFGCIFWVMENLFCGHYGSLQFHALFHLTSSLGPYLWIISICFERHRRRMKTELGYFGLLPIVRLGKKE